MTSIPREDWLQQHSKVIKFMFKHGGIHAARADFLSLAKLTAEKLLQPGTSLLTATVRREDGAHLAGVSFVSGYGDKGCLIAVHPLYRNKGIGTSLLSEQLHQLGQINCSVDLNHIPFLKMCFHAGLKAVSLKRDFSGRPVLVLEGQLQRIGSLVTTSIQEGDPLCHYPS